MRSTLASLLLILLLTGCTLTLPSQPTSSPIPTSEAHTDSGWPVYTNDKYGYTINYHPDWHKQENNEPPYPPPPNTMNFSRKWNEPLATCDFEIFSSNTTDGFAGEIDSLSQNPQYAKTSDTIASTPATKFTHQSPTQLVETYYFQKDPNSYRLGYNIGRGDHFDLCLQTFTQMIASFKFTQ